MASYLELYNLSLNQTMIQRMTVAVAIEAEEIRNEDPSTPNHANRVAWAKRALSNPDGMARQLLLCALAQNSQLTVGQIEGAGDAALQIAVSGAVHLLL